MKFAEFFKTATGGNSPYPYQKAIAEGDSIPELLSVPTGVGKTTLINQLKVPSVLSDVTRDLREGEKNNQNCRKA